ncbi:LysR family transcriptional regulator [Ferrimonas balearica]|uniref:LysR family transcriptional regulator n=1 Tax=Ferrimonas balearica TaxID=44012 RepID=UPI001C99EBDA|nr:LysR family transcriptional regulator [Ferrimonas balearica]MBY5992568.1 LysR family transcriptional regulator [Ferrimonas balearica]
MALERLDLNLLRLMLVLLEEGSVTAAATRLHLGQSAVSKQLAKLREQLGQPLDDPLFVRAGQGLVPTPKAAALEPKLRHWLRLSCELLTPEGFDPRLDERQFRASVVETAFPTLMPKVLTDLQSEAPGVRLGMVPGSNDKLELLERGQLDLLLLARDTDERAHYPWHISHLPDLPQQELYRDINVCLVREGHPALTGRWDQERFLALPHIQIWVEGTELWLMDHVLASQGLRRPVAVQVPDFHSAALMAQQTDMVFTCAGVFARQLTQHYRLTLLPLPLALAPISYRLMWPVLQDRDPAHQWLRAFIAERCQRLGVA